MQVLCEKKYSPENFHIAVVLGWESMSQPPQGSPMKGKKDGT